MIFACKGTHFFLDNQHFASKTFFRRATFKRKRRRNAKKFKTETIFFHLYYKYIAIFFVTLQPETVKVESVYTKNLQKTNRKVKGYL